MSKKHSFVWKILLGFVLGTAIGLVLSECVTPETTQKILPYVAPFGNVLVAMLKMVVYPIILFSLIVGAFVVGLFQNPFAALANGQFLPIIVFSIAFGLSARYLLDRRGEDEELCSAVKLVIRLCDGA